VLTKGKKGLVVEETTVALQDAYWVDFQVTTFVVGQIVGHRGLKYMVIPSTDSDSLSIFSPLVFPIYVAFTLLTSVLSPLSSRPL
jgi:Na+-driven multidrug efflux pump